MRADFEKSDLILKNAFADGRNYLYEHEVYDLLTTLNIGVPPKCSIVRFTEEIDDTIDTLDSLGIDKYVCKIVNPLIIHKSDVGGVEIVGKEDVPDTVRRIFETVPIRQAEISGGSVDEIEKSTYGVLVSEFIDSPRGFGHELLIGMRDTREFGPVISAGLGGIETELYSKEMRRGRAGIAISPGVSDEVEFFDAFTETISYETLTGRARGHARLIEDAVLKQVFAHFHALVWRYSPLNPDAPFHLTECEVNPFLIDSGTVRPVDGLLRFREVVPRESDPPVGKIAKLLHPEKICIVGVSGKSMNLGRIILNKLLNGKFTPDKLAILKSGCDEIDGVKCYSSAVDLPVKFDLAVLAVSADRVLAIVRDFIDSGKIESMILITSALGEKEGSENLELELKEIIRESRTRPDRGPIVVGGNSVGIISLPGGYDTTFQPSHKLPMNPDNPLGGKIAFVSQSGAFILTRISRLGGMVPRYAISTGNEADLSVADFVEHLMDDPEIKVFACYIEGMKRLHGLYLAETCRRVLNNANGERTFVVYKAGRLSEGRSAASGHTAAIAGDWDVADEILTRSGCIVARSFEEFTSLIMLASCLSDRKVTGNRIAALTNAGYEAVGIADNIRGDRHSLELANLTDETKSKLAEILKKYKIDNLVNVRNPIDLGCIRRLILQT